MHHVHHVKCSEGNGFSPVPVVGSRHDGGIKQLCKAPGQDCMPLAYEASDTGRHAEYSITQHTPHAPPWPHNGDKPQQQLLFV